MKSFRRALFNRKRNDTEKIQLISDLESYLGSRGDKSSIFSREKDKSVGKNAEESSPLFEVIVSIWKVRRANVRVIIWNSQHSLATQVARKKWRVTWSCATKEKKKLRLTGP